MLSTYSKKFARVEIASNLISSNIFNPNREIFTINMQSAYVYLNKKFVCSALPLNDSFLDNISFELKFIPEHNPDSQLPELDFKIELEFHEN